MSRRVRKVLRSETSACLFCHGDTLHDVVATGSPRFKWFGGPQRDVRVRAFCRSCGGYRLLSLEDASSEG